MAMFISYLCHLKRGCEPIGDDDMVHCLTCAYNLSAKLIINIYLCKQLFLCNRGAVMPKEAYEMWRKRRQRLDNSHTNSFFVSLIN